MQSTEDDDEDVVSPHLASIDHRSIIKGARAITHIVDVEYLKPLFYSSYAHQKSLSHSLFLWYKASEINAQRLEEIPPAIQIL